MAFESRISHSEVKPMVRSLSEVERETNQGGQPSLMISLMRYLITSRKRS